MTPGPQGRSATLRIPQQADKDVAKLPRDVQGAVMVFMRDFRKNPDDQRLRLKHLAKEAGDGTRLYSARVGTHHRAIMVHTGSNDYLLLTVRDRRDAYDGLDRLSHRINKVTGGIEYINLDAVEDNLTGRAPHAAPDRRVAAAAATASGPPTDPTARPLFEGFSDQELTDLGVAESLLPFVRRVTGEDGLLRLFEPIPDLTKEVLSALHEGRSTEEVMEIVTRPVAAEEEVDTEDYAAALARPATQVTTDDKALEIVLEDPFTRWLVFLHPTQARLVQRATTGPVRVSGGPGTGKTIVALHRVKNLVDRLPDGEERPVLLTTFTRNLAADLRARLLLLGGRELADRVDVVHVDGLASRIAREAETGAPRKQRIGDNDVAREWQRFLEEISGAGHDPDFLAEEWSQVILGQAINSRADYFRARRPGRGRKIGRAERDEIWQLVERFTKRLDEAGKETFQQVAERAARLATEHSGPPHRYPHVVVDEAQDLHAAHWKMLRAMVAPGPDDLFVVGDTHQRVYGNHVSLGSLGINIRGRSTRLTLSYRTTRQILVQALALLHGETFDDLDDGTDSLSGYRSVLNGAAPRLQGFASQPEELDAVAGQARAWLPDDLATARSPVAVCVPTNDLAERVIQRLQQDDIPTVEVKADGPARGEGVHVGTMQRFKGLEYQRMIIAGASDGLVPRRAIQKHEVTDPARYHRERQQERSKLFVAATRARDELVIFWSGTPSPFLPTPDPSESE